MLEDSFRRGEQSTSLALHEAGWRAVVGFGTWDETYTGTKPYSLSVGPAGRVRRACVCVCVCVRVSWVGAPSPPFGSVAKGACTMHPSWGCGWPVDPSCGSLCVMPCCPCYFLALCRAGGAGAAAVTCRPSWAGGGCATLAVRCLPRPPCPPCRICSRCLAYCGPFQPVLPVIRRRSAVGERAPGCPVGLGRQHHGQPRAQPPR